METGAASFPHKRQGFGEGSTGMAESSEKQQKTSVYVESGVDVARTFAEHKKATPAQVALAWLLAQPCSSLFPEPRRYIGSRKTLVLDVSLTADDRHDIERSVSRIEVRGGRYPEASQRMVDR